MDTDTKIRRVVGILCLVAIVWAGYQILQKRSKHAPSAVGGAAPAFTLGAVGSDEQVSLEQFRGKVVLIDFWATWCPPCRKQMPEVQKLADDDELDETLQILSVNTDDGGNDRQQRVSTYLDDNGYSFTTLIDDGRVASSYGVTHLPTLVVIDPHGELAHVESGVHSEADLRAYIEEAAQRAAD
jgi:thiol-disulfide isomerase/thioredoxin